MNLLSPGDRFFPDRVVPEPISVEVSGDGLGETAGGGGPQWMECGYRNASDRMVILRCVGPGSFFLERVVFPFELLSFACPPESEVEIFTHSLGGPELLEAMPAWSLRLDTPLPLELTAVEALLDASPWAEAG
ncbi:MAG: DUF1830 domain-containing protein [Cyanobium sp.]